MKEDKHELTKLRTENKQLTCCLCMLRSVKLFLFTSKHVMQLSVLCNRASIHDLTICKGTRV